MKSRAGNMMYAFVFYVVVSTKLVLGEDCDKSGILIYEDIGCTPAYGSDKKCPVKYSCVGLETSEKNCYFRGRSYANREQVESSFTSPSCDEGCICLTDSGKAEFTCAVLDCPEWLGGSLRPGCYRKHALGQCCSVGQACPPFEKIEKCVFEESKYNEGQKFYPSNTCMSCVCQKGFKGKLEEPFCERRRCGQQLRSRSGNAIKASCAPFYSKELHNEVLCCPDHWICSEESEVIKGEGKSEDFCKFGDKTMKVGQYVEKLNVKDSFGRSFAKVRCECLIPPFLKCIDV